MGAFVSKLSDLFALLIQQLRLAALIPAALFITLNSVFVVPLARQVPLISDWLDAFPQDGDITIAILTTLSVGYTLIALNVPIIRFFEGYSFIEGPLSFLYRSQARLFHYLQKEAQTLAEEAKEKDRRARQTGDTKVLAEARRCQMQVNAIRHRLRWEYPSGPGQEWRLLPTRLGNVIAAAEAFPQQTYRMDSVSLWSYLVPILAEEGFAPLIEREKSVMDFLLNLAVLSLVIGAELAFLTCFGPDFPHAWPHSLVILLLFFLLAFNFYLFAIPAAIGWGLGFRVAFALYRNDLRERLGLVSPKDYYDELWLWESASAFYRDKDSWMGRLIFDYESSRLVDNKPGEEKEGAQQ